MPSARLLVWPAIALLFFAAVAPTLSWLDFSGGMENLNVATALELRRDHPGNWLIPTLEGERRIKKPPLTAWLTAHAIRPATVRALSDPDPQVRRAAADRLAFEVRWPALLAACLMLVAVYELGRVVADPTAGLVAALIGGTTLMFLKFGRSSMIDVHLGLWVMVCNVCLAHAILRDRRWFGCLGAGFALGVSFMLKGPPAFVQSLAPAVLYVFFRGWHEVRAMNPARWIAPIALGLLVMLAVAVPWYVYIYRTVPDAWHVWRHEATDDRGERPSTVLGYLAFLPYLLPWTVCFLGGLFSARRAMVLAAFLAVGPLLLMTLYKDRKERYMFPVTGAACVVAAAGVMTLARKRADDWTPLDRAAVAQHWIILVALGLLLPAAATTTRIPGLVTADGHPWLPRQWGAGLTIGLGVAIAAGLCFRRHWLPALLAVTVIVMTAVHAAVIHGYAQTDSGLSPMRPLAESIWRQYPTAEMYNAHPRGKRASVDLSIYLNRITDWVSLDDLTRMQPGPRPKVVVMLQEENTPAPTPPSGWTYVDKVTRKKDYWWAFALPAAQ
jgi:4-amino-4-deoxy-L-arabinose transferase-like glycosyltransferase